MADALLHSDDFQPSRRPPQPGTPGLLFKSGMENIVACVGAGHSNPATVTSVTATVTMVTDTPFTLSPVMHVPIFYVLEHRRPEPRGFIGNSSRIQISGCLQ